MEVSQILTIVKARLGITSTVRDTYIQEIIKGVIDELEKVQGLVLDGTNSAHLMFVVDFSSWRYENKDAMSGMPRHLQFRLHNLMISSTTDGDAT